jgi:hypothetical protein
MLKLSRDWLIGLSVVAAGVIYSLPVAAQAPAEIRACVHNGNNQLRLLAAGQSCANNERLVTWNLQGPKGDKGDTGATGATGARGETGPQGPQGVAGKDGVPGAPGATGPQGPSGDQGAPGKDGRDGIDGRDGTPGNVGPQGPAGQDGRDGVPGNVGPEGPQGGQGSQGPAGPAGPGAGMIIGLINPMSCGATVTSTSLVAHILNTNLFAPVTATTPSGNSTSGGPKTPKDGKVFFYPFTFYGVPAGNYTIEIGNLAANGSDGGDGVVRSLARFEGANSIANVIVGPGGVTNVGTIGLDPSCLGKPIDVCGNGLDENNNGTADENCPCTGAACSALRVCADLNMAQCNDGTCRNFISECPIKPKSTGVTCAMLVCSGANEVCVADSKGQNASCGCAEGYDFDGSGTCVAIDACATGANTCAPGACSVTGPGTFACECPVGTTGDGVTCTPVSPPSETAPAATAAPAPPNPGGGWL